MQANTVQNSLTHMMERDNKYMNNWFVIRICTFVIQITILVRKESNIWNFLHPCRAWIFIVSDDYFDTIQIQQIYNPKWHASQYRIMQTVQLLHLPHWSAMANKPLRTITWSKVLVGLASSLILEQQADLEVLTQRLNMTRPRLPFVKSTPSLPSILYSVAAPLQRLHHCILIRCLVFLVLVLFFGG